MNHIRPKSQYSLFKWTKPEKKMLHWLWRNYMKCQCYYGTFLLNYLCPILNLCYCEHQQQLKNLSLKAAFTSWTDWKSPSHTRISFWICHKRQLFWLIFLCVWLHGVPSRSGQLCIFSQSGSFYDFIPSIISVHWASRQLVKLHNF